MHGGNDGCLALLDGLVPGTDDGFGAWHQMLDLYQVPKAIFVPGTINRICTWYKSINLYPLQTTSIAPGTNQTLKKTPPPTTPTAPSILSHNSGSLELLLPLHEPSADTHRSPTG